MAINPIIFNAILSMDAYNRGYNAGIEFTQPEGSIGQRIGNYVIVNQSQVLENQQGVNIGFYGIAYELSGGEIIISYRGADDVDGIPNPLTNLDVQHGWTLGAGNTASQQGRMAVEFYQAVAGSGNWLSADISLTGHSLGGGLAGYVANDNRPERFPGRKVA